MSFGIPVRNGVGVGLLASTSLSTRRGTAGPPPAASFIVLDAGGTSYTTTRNVLDVSGASFAVPQTVLAADGTPYSVL